MTHHHLSLLGFSIDVIGKILIAYTALMVHHRFWKEHKIDDIVFAEMKKEKRLALIGICFIVLGYFLQLPTKILAIS